MTYQLGSRPNELRISRLATAVVRVVEKRALRGFYQRRLWRALQPSHQRPLRLTDPEIRALQQYVYCFSLQRAEELQNYHRCLDQVGRWNQWLTFLFGHRRFLGDRERLRTQPSSELIAPGGGFYAS